MAIRLDLDEAYFRSNSMRPYHERCEFTLRGTAKKADGTAQDLTGATLRFYLSDAPASTPAVYDFERIQGGAGDSVHIAFTVPLSGQFEIYFKVADLATARRGRWYQIFIEPVGSQRVVWWEGYFDILPAIAPNTAVNVNV